MLFHLADYLLDSPIYAVYMFETNLTEREFFAIASKLRYYARLDNISWLAVYSSTESSSAKIEYEKTKKRGRPKKYVAGKKVNAHCHISVIGSPTKSAYSTALKFKNAVDKKRGKKICRVVSKGDSFDARVWIGYCLKQADILRSGGDFDFAEHQIIL